MPLKPEFRTGAFTLLHIPLARLSHEAKREVTGVGGLLPPTEKHGKNREGRKNRKQIQSAREKPLVMGVTLRRDETSPQFEVICISVW